MCAETIDVFFWCDEIAEFIGFGFVEERKLDDDATDRWVGISSGDFGGDFVGGFGIKIFDCDADICAVTDFEIDIHGDDGIVTVTNNEKLGFFL